MFLRKFSLYARNFSNKRRCVVDVVGAVRTPFFSEDNPSILLASVIDEVIKRATLPKADIDEVCVVGLRDGDAEKLRASCDQLHKSVHLETSKNATTSISKAIEKLETSKAKLVVISGVETKILTLNESLKNVSNFDIEMMPVFSRSKRSFVLQDEFVDNKPVSIATAIALAVPDYSAKLNIKSLASLTHVRCNDKDDLPITLEDFLDVQNIQRESCRWELLLPQDVEETLVNQLKLDASKDNCYELASVIKEVPSIGPAILLTNLVHSLQRKQNGLICACDGEHLFFTMLLRKFSYLAPQSQPILTLYTKDCCPLCDELVYELEQHFKNEYHLKKIFIDRKENIRFLRLYRSDIPVLFLNGHFVCMHRLNKNLLRQMLTDLSKDTDTVI